MTATQFSWSERRALRWMSRRGTGLQPTEPAFQLLADRVRRRWWAGLVTYGLLAVFVVGWIWWSPLPLDGRPVTESVVVSLVPVVVFGVLQTAFVELGRHADARLAATLPHRISRPEAVRWRTVVGPLAALLVVVAVVGHGVIAVVLFRRAGSSNGVAYLVGLAVIAVVVAFTSQRVLRRPTVALDPTSLALDERLRATDALLALWPLYWAAVGLSASLDLRGKSSVGVVFVIGFVLAVASSAVWFSHPAEQVRFGLGPFRRRRT